MAGNGSNEITYEDLKNLSDGLKEYQKNQLSHIRIDVETGKVIHEDMAEAIDLITCINENKPLETFPLTHEDNFRGHTHVYRVGNPNPIRVQRSSIFREEDDGSVTSIGNNRVYTKEVIKKLKSESRFGIYTFSKSAMLIIEGFEIDSR